MVLQILKNHINIPSSMIKRFLFGTIPYFWTKLIAPKSEYLPYYHYIMCYGYSRHLFDFRHEYKDMIVDLYCDETNNLPYIVVEGKRLYFKKGLQPQKIIKLYKELIIEQDKRSAHHYFDNAIEQIKGKAFLDIGGAEGLISLSVIDIASHIYIFECDPLWIEALEATFQPWKEKVTIVNKLIGNETNENSLTLDDFFSNRSHDNLFLKMDIEGSELDALKGACQLFSQGKNLSFAICTYHEEDDGKAICSMLDTYQCKYTHQRGFFRKKIRSVVVQGKNNLV